MSSRKVLVVAAHPDDEVLGCGGTLIKHAEEGDSVHVLFMTDGVSARNSTEMEPLRIERENAARAAAAIMKIDSIQFLDFPDNRLDGVDLLDVVQAIENKVNHFNPHIVYTHHSGDLNIDHRITHQAILTACRPISSRARRIMCFEVLSSTEWSAKDTSFRPNWYVGIDQYLERKIEALLCYKTEIKSFPHPRSTETIQALAKLRGSASGLPSAEAFCLHREICQ